MDADTAVYRVGVLRMGCWAVKRLAWRLLLAIVVLGVTMGAAKAKSKARLFCPAQFQRFHPQGACYIADDGRSWDCEKPVSMECLAVAVDKGDGQVEFVK